MERTREREREKGYSRALPLVLFFPFQIVEIQFKVQTLKIQTHNIFSERERERSNSFRSLRFRFHSDRSLCAISVFSDFRSSVKFWESDRRRSSKARVDGGDRGVVSAIGVDATGLGSARRRRRWRNFKLLWFFF